MLKGNKPVIILIAVLLVIIFALGLLWVSGRQTGKGSSATSLPTQQNSSNSQQGGPDTPGAPGAAPEAPGGAGGTN